MSLAIASAVVICLPAPSRAAWSPPFAVTDIGRAYGPVVATSPLNGAVVAWLDGGTNAVWARRIAPDGTLGPERKLSPRLGSFAEGLDIAIDRSGAAVVIWYDHELDRGYSLHARRMGARGRLGPARRLAPPLPLTAQEASVEVDAKTGSATVVWSQVFGTSVEPKGVRLTSGTIHARSLRAHGSLGPSIELPAGDAINRSPRLAVSSSGGGTVAWVAHEDRGYFVRAARLGSRGRAGAVHEVSVPQQWWSGNAPEVLAETAGGASIAWTETMGDGLGRRAFARRLSADGLGPAHLLPQGPIEHSPAVAKDSSGTALVLWNAGTDSEPSGRRLAVDGVASPVWQLSSGRYGMPAIAVDSSGQRATVVWASSTDFYRSPTRVMARQIMGDGRMGPVSMLVDDPLGYMREPAAVADSRGSVLAVWSRSRRSQSTLQAARLVRACPVVRLRRAVAKPPMRYRPGRVRGLRVRLVFDRAAEIRFARTRLTFRSPRTGRRRSLRVRSSDALAASKVRFALPKRLRHVLRLRQPVSLRVRLRAKPHASGCPYGKARTVTVRARVGWIDRS
jgi:hypothetical protein